MHDRMEGESKRSKPTTDAHPREKANRKEAIKKGQSLGPVLLGRNIRNVGIASEKEANVASCAILEALQRIVYLNQINPNASCSQLADTESIMMPLKTLFPITNALQEFSTASRKMAFDLALPQRANTPL